MKKLLLKYIVATERDAFLFLFLITFASLSI